MKFKSDLQKLSACSDSVAWVGDKTIEDAWSTCERGDWMLWLYAKSKDCDIHKLTLAKGHCANLVRELMKDERSRNAIDVAISFGEGVATKEQLTYAAADAADAAADAYAYADAAAAYAAYAAAAAAAAAAADADAAAAAAAAYAAYADDRKESLQKSADICRKYLPIPTL